MELEAVDIIRKNMRSSRVSQVGNPMCFSGRDPERLGKERWANQRQTVKKKIGRGT